ncbi:hypothetical protein BKA70DRAFT_1306783 [Coprinopsis sp. MPI-PUGE-AT-0042]|nr:hypothetical protein BKA70DRAFT_1306783 [Coprinopsis sp. MPI-PUGE-AT-0042]
MSARKARRVMLDTTSSSLKLAGNWTSGGPLFGASASSGVPATSRLEANQQGSMESVFTGSEMIMYGVSNSFGQPFDCTVDGLVANVSLWSWGFDCSWKGEETSEPHTVRLSTTRPLEAALWIESLWYLPSPKALPTLGTGEWAVYEHDDPDLVYFGTWGDLTHSGESASISTQSGAGMDVRFRGTRVIWDGRIPGAVLGGSNSEGQIQLLSSLDQGPTMELGPASLAIFPSADATEQQYNLTVSRLGASSTPFAIYHIFVEGGDLQLDTETDLINETITSTSIAVSPSSSPPPQLPPSTRKVSTGAIVGAVVSGFIFITCVVVALVWTRKRRKSRRANDNLHQPIAAFFGNIASPATYRKRRNTQDGSTSDMALTPLKPDQTGTLSTHRKGQIPSSSGSSQNVDSSISPRQHQDSGIRLDSDTASLPPIYTME